MRLYKVLLGFIAFLMTLSMAVPVNAAQRRVSGWETAMNAALDWMLDATPDGPAPGGVVGEWAVYTLARAERIDADDPWAQSWLGQLDNVLGEIKRTQNANPGISINRPPSAGTFPLPLRRWTDFQRVALALEALGLDATDYNGFDFTAPYRFFVPTSQRHALNRTILADLYALVAIEAVGCGGRDNLFLANVIHAQRRDGTWSLNPAQPTSLYDIDITAMALQALAPYYRRGENRVVRAVERATDWLFGQTFTDPESTAQMIMGLTALGDKYAEEAAYYVEWLMRWFNPAAGGFVRTVNPSVVNAMATVQAAQALVEYYYFINESGAVS
jgi:hypothetical protein